VTGLTGRPSTRLAELVAALSLGIDLGFGQPMEHVLRQCLIALRLAERAGLDAESRSDVYYTSLLLGVGCHTDAHEQAKWFGDDIAMKSGKYDAEMIGWRSAADMLRRLGAGRPPLHRFRTGLEFAFGGYRQVERMIDEHARLAQKLAEQLGLEPAVQEAIGGSYERWDGKGWPGKLSGAQIPIAARIGQLAEFLEVAYRTGGVEAAVAMARARSGAQFDPDLARCVERDGAALFADLDGIDTWQKVIDSEPALDVVLTNDELDGALVAVADFVDLKSPYTLGHSRAVAALTERAAVVAGFAPAEVSAVRRAALVHDFGRLGVSNAIWDKPGPLGRGEWERVRTYPYLTERMLDQSDALAPAGRLAAQVGERMDGSGYPRRLGGQAFSIPARLLAAADVYQAMREPRPHRSARSPDDAAAELTAEVRAGRLDAGAVEAVLTAAGHRPPRRTDGPAGLTAREVDVLRLVARGCSNKEIAQRLVISPKTVGHHVEHIYAKIGANNRAGASLFAVQHALLPEDDPV
jgi:HD-GYP domain-containing protein (c-di-GMP phosphodiesterase class II)